MSCPQRILLKYFYIENEGGIYVQEDVEWQCMPN